MEDQLRVARLTGNMTEVAKFIMSEIIYDNGRVNAQEVEKYSVKHLERIAKGAKVFFDKHPHLLTEYNLIEIATGEFNYVDEKFRSLPMFDDLDEALDAFFNEVEYEDDSFITD